MDIDELVKSRCAEAQLDATVKRDPTETVRETRSARTLQSPVSTRSRGLPKISVELRGTLDEGPARAMPAIGERDLEVQATLGEGGMGRVFAARQHSLQRDVAIKTVRDHASDGHRAALLTEGQIMGSLEHPAIIPVHQLGLDEAGRPVLVMKRVDGAIEWSALLDDPAHEAWKTRRSDVADRLEAHLDILMQVASAAHFAHGRGVIHRDIKPQNVLLGAYGEVYLADWGIGIRVDDGTPPGPLTGTPAYMAPEMVIGEAIDARTDVYLLGGTLHRVLSGKPRHVASDLGGTLLAAALSDPIDYGDDVPQELGALANRATSKDRGARPPSAEAFRAEVAGFLRHRSSVTLAATAEARLEKLRHSTTRDGLGEDAQHGVDLVAAEARFALQQALDQWPENAAAKAALGELDALLAARRARAAELERFARDNDVAISSRERALTVAAIAIAGVGLSLSALFLTENPSVSSLFVQSLAPLAALGFAAFALRGRMTWTQANRRMLFGFGVIMASVTVSRLQGLFAGLDAATLLARECVMLAALCALTAIYVQRWILLPGVVMLAASFAAARLPDRAFMAFSVATGVSLVLCAFGARRLGNSRATS